MGILITRMPRPRQFNYSPLYYDERKERIEKIKAKAEAEFAAEKNKAPYTGLQKGFLSENRSASKFNRSENLKGSSGRLLRYVMIVAVILGIFYLVAPDVFLSFWKFK